MAKRGTLDDRLAAVRSLRDQPASPELVVALRKAIGDRSNFLAAAAAEIAGEKRLIELAGDLEAAHARFLVDPLTTDKLCRAKTAIVEALDRMEHDGLATFEAAARHEQLEPVWEGKEDSAVPLRAAALLALTRLDAPGLLTLLVDALNDPIHRKSKSDVERQVRIAAAQAIGHQGSEAAALVLRLKARAGDRDPEVVSECLHGLLTISHPTHLDFVASFLDPGDEPRCEAAVMALGRSRLAEAFEPLDACWRRELSPPLREAVFLAISMLRAPRALDRLLELAGGENPAFARTALTALKIHRHDAKLTDRIAAVVAARGDRALQAQFDREFKKED